MNDFGCGQPSNTIKTVSSVWTRRDAIGQIRCRLFDSFRMNYRVDPGIYAVGKPHKQSPVFASANYKLSFDILRRSLNGIDAWILVLDTKGINVWCAAGKGTFGTQELVSRIRSVSLETFVDHRRIIVPQLGAAGVHAHSVKEQTGFTVFYGPVHAIDIKTYMANGHKATREMRNVKFDMIDRLILVPMEFSQVIKKICLFIVFIFIIFGLNSEGIIFRPALHDGLPLFFMLLCAILTGSIATPVFLPYIPSASFAVKGWLMGLIPVLFLPAYMHGGITENIFLYVITLIFFPLFSSFLALNFTGCTTFTSVSGVKRELKIAVPIYITGLVISGILLVIYKIQTWNML